MFRQAASLALAFYGCFAFAQGSCTDWSLQNDGSYWRLCTNDRGHRVCQSKRGDEIKTVPCEGR